MAKTSLYDRVVRRVYPRTCERVLRAHGFEWTVRRARMRRDRATNDGRRTVRSFGKVRFVPPHVVNCVDRLLRADEPYPDATNVVTGAPSRAVRLDTGDRARHNAWKHS